MDHSLQQRSGVAEKLQQAAFQPLQQDAFAGLQHAPFLKGLLKPFKGKGDGPFGGTMSVA